MTMPPEPTEDVKVYDPTEDPHSFEPKPIYTETNEDFEEEK